MSKLERNALMLRKRREEEKSRLIYYGGSKRKKNAAKQTSASGHKSVVSRHWANERRRKREIAKLTSKGNGKEKKREAVQLLRTHWKKDSKYAIGSKEALARLQRKANEAPKPQIPERETHAKIESLKSVTADVGIMTSLEFPSSAAAEAANGPSPTIAQKTSMHASKLDILSQVFDAMRNNGDTVRVHDLMEVFSGRENLVHFDASEFSNDVVTKAEFLAATSKTKPPSKEAKLKEEAVHEERKQGFLDDMLASMDIHEQSGASESDSDTDSDSATSSSSESDALSEEHAPSESEQSGGAKYPDPTSKQDDEKQTEKAVFGVDEIQTWMACEQSHGVWPNPTTEWRRIPDVLVKLKIRVVPQPNFRIYVRTSLEKLDGAFGVRRIGRLDLSKISLDNDNASAVLGRIATIGFLRLEETPGKSTRVSLIIP